MSQLTASSVRSTFARLLAEAPHDAQAVEFADGWWTWGQLRRLAHALEDVLAGAGLADGTRVGVALENRPEHVAVVAQLVASGRCLVTLSPLQPAERLADDIRRSAAPVVVASPEVLSRPGVLEAVTATGIAVEVDAEGGLRVLGGEVGAAVPTSPGVAVEMLTSGTTGPPKRVRITDAQLDTALLSAGQLPRTGVLLARGIGLVATPMVHIGGLWGVLAGLHAGRRLTLLPKFALEPWVAAVERHRLRAAGLVPAALRAVLDAGVPAERLASLQVITCGTAPCPPELADAFFRAYGARVLITYGATEFAGAIAGWTLPLHEQWWERKPGSTGRPYPGVSMRVVDADGNVLGAGTTGHLEIRTAQAAQGPDAWVRTSDLGSLDEDGFLWLAGRADDAIIRGGFKVHPEQVRTALERHPAVLEAAVTGMPDERLGQIPVAAVECRPGMDAPSVEELVALCRQQLTPYEVPAHIVVVAELPRTPSSKVSHVELLELVHAQRSTSGAA